MIEIFLDTMTIREASVEDKVRISAAMGFAGPRIRGADVVSWCSTGRTVADLMELMHSQAVRSPGFVTESDVYDWHVGDVHTGALRDALKQSMSIAAQLGGGVVLLPVMSDEGSWSRMIKNLTEVSHLGDAHGLKIGLEFIGHIPKVPDVATAWRAVQEVGQDNLGLVVDSFHFYRGGSRLEDLSPIPAQYILAVDLSDAMDLPREALLGYRHRLYPGEGVAGVSDLLTVLFDKGFQGPCVIELFNETYWRDNPEAVAARALDATRQLLATTGAGRS